MAPLPPFCSAKKNGKRRTHINPHIPCLYCGLDPDEYESADSQQSEDEDLGTADKPVSLSSGVSESEAPADDPIRKESTTPVPKASSPYRFAPVSSRTTATSGQPHADNIKRIALQHSRASNERSRSRQKDHAGDPPPSSATPKPTAQSTKAKSKDKTQPALLTEPFKFGCVGILEQAYFKNAFFKENNTPNIALRTVSCTYQMFCVISI